MSTTELGEVSSFMSEKEKPGDNKRFYRQKLILFLLLATGYTALSVSFMFSEKHLLTICVFLTPLLCLGVSFCWLLLIQCCLEARRKPRRENIGGCFRLPSATLLFFIITIILPLLNVATAFWRIIDGLKQGLHAIMFADVFFFTLCVILNVVGWYQIRKKA